MFEGTLEVKEKNNVGEISMDSRDSKNTKEATYSTSYSDLNDISEGLYCSTYKRNILFYCLKNRVQNERNMQKHKHFNRLTLKQIKYEKQVTDLAGTAHLKKHGKKPKKLDSLSPGHFQRET